MNIMVMYMYIAPGWGRPAPGIHLLIFQNHKHSVHLPISITFFPSNDILTIFPHSNAWAPIVDLAIT